MNMQTALNNLLEIYNKPLSFITDPSVIYRVLAVITLFPPLFIITFNPFGIINTNKTFLLYVAIFGYGIVSGIIVYGYTILIPKKMKTAFTKFTLGKAILYSLGLLTTMAAGNFIYKNALSGFEEFHLFGFLNMLIRTLLISSLPVILILFWVHNHTLKKNLKVAALIDQEINNKTRAKNILIRSENNKEFLKVDYRDMLYIENADNYVVVYYLKNERVVRSIIRTSLKNIQNEIVNPKLTRCHRSFIVNLEKVQHVTGNSRGLFIKLFGVETKIPVSRKYVEHIRNILHLD